jgi:phage terminase large subunit GpA-like protein
MVHFPAGLPDEFFEQLTSERLVTKHLRGMPKREWVKASSARNEALDATVYAYAAAVYAGLKRADWAVLKVRAATGAVVTSGGVRRVGRIGAARG